MLISWKYWADLRLHVMYVILSSGCFNTIVLVSKPIKYCLRIIVVASDINTYCMYEIAI